MHGLPYTVVDNDHRTGEGDCNMKTMKPCENGRKISALEENTHFEEKKSSTDIIKNVFQPERDKTWTI